ncbi:MAG: hypothetical protein AB8F78_16115 [Saprospiraceae bacterium]
MHTTLNLHRSSTTLRSTLFYAIFMLLLSSCQDVKDNFTMNKELFMTKTECFAEIEGINEARMAVSTQGPHDGIMFQILTVQAKLNDGVSHTDMPKPDDIIECLRPILNKYPKLTHIGIKYKDHRTEERDGLEDYDVLVKK